VISALPHRAGVLVLRPLRLDDLPAFLAYRARADVAAWQGWEPMSEAAARAYLQEQAGAAPLRRGGWRQIGIADAADDALLGDLGVWLAPDAARAEVGITVHPDRQGGGLGREAVQALLGLLFRHTPVHEVIAVADVRNAACLRMLARAGMQPETTRDAMFKGEACVEQVFVVRRG
jgi:ribosomal-protein-alanine N-acetyltransferase